MLVLQGALPSMLFKALYDGCLSASLRTSHTQQQAGKLPPPFQDAPKPQSGALPLELTGTINQRASGFTDSKSLPKDSFSAKARHDTDI